MRKKLSKELICKRFFMALCRFKSFIVNIFLLSLYIPIIYVIYILINLLTLTFIIKWKEERKGYLMNLETECRCQNNNKVKIATLSPMLGEIIN